MIEEVILTTENCRYCLMCRHVCPVGHVTRKETFTPHGWGLIIAAVRRGMLDLDQETVNVLYSCADCGTCRANCITDQPLPSAIAAMRAEVVDKGLAPPAVTEVHARLRDWENPHREQAPSTPAGQGRVALYIGDDAHYLGQEIVTAVLKLLKAVGVEPVLIGVGRNNGYLASSLGYPDTGSALVQATLDELESTGAESMLVLSTGDHYAFGQMRDDRLDLSWPDGAVLQEVLPFLAEHLNAGSLAFSRLDEGDAIAPYAYVDPTHSVRVTTRYDAPRRLLEAVMPVPARELFWRGERSHPVGNVALQYTQPHISNHLTYARLGDALERGVRLLITEDAGTLTHLRRHSDRFGLRIAGLYELLAGQLA